MRLQVAIPRRLLLLGLVSGVAWVMNLVALSYTARSLGTSSFGLLAFGLSVTAYGAVLAVPGLNVWGVRRVASERDTAGRYLIVVNGVQLVLGAVVYALLALFAIAALANDQQRIVLVAGIGVLSAAFGTQWLCQALERYDLLAVSLLVTAATSLSALVVFVHGPGDVYVIPIVTLASQIVASGAILQMLRAGGLIRLAPIGLRQVLAALRTSVALGLAPVIIAILHNSNTLILQAARGSDAVGVFTAGYRLVEMLSLVPTLVTTLFFARLARAATNREAWATTMRVFVRLTIGFAFFPATLMLVEAGSVAALLYGLQFPQSDLVIRIMAVAVLFNFAAIAYLMGLLAAHRDREYIVAISAGATLSVLAGLIIVPSSGLIGAAAVVSVLDLIVWLFALRPVRAVSGSFFLEEWQRPTVVAAAVAAWLALSSTVGVPFLVRGVVGLIVYVAFVFVRSRGTEMRLIEE
jgi:O-antigen/teichoic acid export membrane protein